ncbi:hypothetical protein CC85DRAFT_321131 [Cutaneotrichosporon oleaginosum]|uniref:Midasin n=1 Tax=Cutaneotrichosporon oleaginosum TaxID=879819 RepID=A0A0J1B003_9TREE|nr:uncharacterized protein CC85DRAFT_321131 [Cutaneotrichosporon oleaginosum]KLT40914.1 hypothetical protein CC85DRAFT_321131 [Cutaneotrichosporon oleaginosum]TXT15407.1 hypothetical protein COLE_01600 [Cutaneotrichosporon oleaginosum]
MTDQADSQQNGLTSLSPSPSPSPSSSPFDHAPPPPISSPLNCDLAQRAHLLFLDLEDLPLPASGATTEARGAFLLHELATIAAVPGAAEPVFRRFAPLALDIVARWLDDHPSQKVWEARLSVLAALAEPRPDLWSVTTAFLERSPFASNPLAVLSDPLNADADRAQCLLLGYWRLLTSDPGLAKRLDWPTAPLHALRSHQSAGVRLLAVQVLSKIRGWSEARRAEMEACVGDDAPILFGYTLENGKAIQTIVDGWMLPVLEARRVRGYTEDALAEGEVEPALAASELSPRTAVVGGRLLFRQPGESSLVHVPTAAIDAAIAGVAPRLQRGLPVLISAPPSAGKTHIVQHLSATLYPTHLPTSRILTIPLADTTIDVKSLIGTYVSSPTKPGTFEWMEGALAKAVRAGRWVVFEDIDRASLEMLVTISGITKSLALGRVGRRAALQVPGREEIEAGDGFAMFATRTVRAEATTPPTFFGHQDFVEVHLAAPTDEDILAILTAQFPRLPSAVTTALVGVWRDLRPLSKTSGQVKARDIGLRDLEKWCARVQRALPPPASLAAFEAAGNTAFANAIFQDECLLDAADIFLASLDNRAGSAEKRAKMIEVIALGLGMEIERATSLLDARRPELEAERGASKVNVGRYAIDSAPKKRKVATDAQPYALTRPSMVTLERIAAAVALAEPTLLVGETGTGKTTSVQHLANLVGKPLTALNLSTQTETSDLVGGFKPIDAVAAARTVHAKWQKLFADTFIVARGENAKYLELAGKFLAKRKWDMCAKIWNDSAERALKKLEKMEAPEPEADEPRKRRKLGKSARAMVLWQALKVEVADFNLHHVQMKSKLVFSFVEGPLVRALKNGEWILLDEVNLASQETLEAVATILEAPTASLVLTERGDVEPVTRHPDFRLFACMNPATDVGKKDLPAGLRARFTELYVPPPDDDREALVSIVEGYLADAARSDHGVILDVVELYTTLKRLSAAKEIVDGSNAAPHYSMRTLARALMFAVQSAPTFGLRRGLWEGMLMAFTMSLDAESNLKAHAACEKHILAPMKNARAVLAQIPTLPANLDPDDYVRFGPFWLQRGPLPPVEETRYIITPSVQAKLSDLARVILTKRYPVLIQGPTSAGKTSAVEFLARQTGHRFVRINNHEHTDIQEYLGTYVTDPQTGNLVFQEGLLVTAVRQGHWIVLDELNLAPTDVLEALNRLLDDNRELVIPETQEVIKPHPNFILFATQNPPGLYAGRKVLSRAFRNRFLEVHFDDVPKDELETILCQRCAIAPTYAKKIVQVFEELRHLRQASRVFEAKSSFATLRDLFRWAERGAVGYQQLAEDGYMLLAERARSDDDKVVIKEVIEKIMKVKVDVANMYQLFDGREGGVLSRLPFQAVPAGELVWTQAMQRLFALVAAAAAHDEPVLLVGETGCGKTSVCEVLAAAFGQKLVGINCHQNMETADLLGSQRPVRNRLERRAKVLARMTELGLPHAPEASDDDLSAACAAALKREDLEETVRADVRELQREIKRLGALFEWVDGPLIHAMTAGDLLLLDEVSLADDSVLERLNSVLEPGRTLVLAEKGGVDIDEATIVAHPHFHVVATMNPGGDFGKKELSPALRNRFTEIWVPALSNRADMLQIIGEKWRHEALRPTGPLILDFFKWFGERVGDSAGLGLRDILAWVNFANEMYGALSVSTAFHHGGQLVVADGLESLPQVSGSSTATIAALRKDCLTKLTEMALTLGPLDAVAADTSFSVTDGKVSIGGFAVPRGPLPIVDTAFRFEAPTTALNAMRVLRGCQLPKAILLEGSPGVGKTSLVSALAATAGFHLQRINLSDQTDLIDLFGSDLPVEGGAAGEFQWRDAAFLDAMQKGDWVLLDEMNLASQTVLEGLNAVLDHRGTVYIPELGRSFDRHPAFRVFAAQNPLTQGGGRKGLPKSFLNRFTKVYLQEHTSEDLLMICRGLYPEPELVERMIAFNEAIREATMLTRSIGREGSPWEFNLRDLFRWFGLLSQRNGLELTSHPVEHLRTIYLQRFRNAADRAAVAAMFENAFGVTPSAPRPICFTTPSWLQIGHAALRRSASASVDTQLPHHQLPLAESVLKTLEMGWLVILAGDNGRGKRGVVRAIAARAGRHLGEFAMHPGVDTSEILGTFEQQDAFRALDAATSAVRKLLEDAAEAHPAAAARVPELQAARNRCDDPRQIDAVKSFTALARSILVEAQATGIPTTAAALTLDAVERGSSSGFAWVDGQLLHALRNGGWFLVSDANLCSASVLDRLNSLCEIDGLLVMSEKGSASGAPEVIKPHPDFRLFMTYDPRHGELSRAMRNRGVELYVDAAPVEDETPTAGKTFALAETSTLRSAENLLSSYNESLSPSSFTANLAALQSRATLVPLGRLAALSDENFGTAISFLSNPRIAELLSAQTAIFATKLGSLASEVPFDLALDANVGSHAEFILFRALQLVLRNEAARAITDGWISDPTHAKTVLAASAISARRGTSKRKPAVGDGVYPLLNHLRDTLAAAALDAAANSNSAALEAAERMLVFTALLEDHCRSEAFDYSSVQLLATWLLEQLNLIAHGKEVRQSLGALGRATKITRGLGQAGVWTLFRSELSPAQRAVVARLLDRLDGVADARLRSDTAQALAVAACDDEQLAELSALIDSLPRRPEESTAADTPWSNAAVARVIELDALNAAVGGTGTGGALALLASAADARPADLVSMQRLSTPGGKLGAVAAWLNRLSTSLFEPVALAAALRFSQVKVTPMAQLASMDDALKFTTESTLWGAARGADRAGTAGNLAFALLSMVLGAFSVSLTNEDNKPVLSAGDMDEAAATYLREAFDSRLAPAIVEAQEGSLLALGHLWHGLGRFVLDLFVTNVPIDPGVRRVLLGEVVATQLSLVADELDVVTHVETELKGVSDSARAETLRARAESLQAEGEALGPSIQRETNAARLGHLFSEVFGFIEDVLEKGQSLLHALENGANAAAAREEAFQLASAAFVQRLHAYTDLVDLAEPILFGVLCVKFGMRCLARNLALRSAAPPTTVGPLVSFPAVASLATLQVLPKEVKEPSMASMRADLLAALAHARDIAEGTQRREHVPGLVGGLDRLYAAWSAIRTREAQEALDAESMYRMRKTDIEVPDDAELEAKEFAQLFPTYDEDEDEQMEQDVPEEKQPHDKHKAKFSTPQVAAFHTLVLASFGKSRGHADIIKTLKSTIDDVLFRFEPAAFREDLDVSSLAFQVATLHRRHAEVKTSAAQANFYFDPNEYEVRKGQALLERLRARLDALVAEWPDQMVLQHLRERVLRILQIDVRSPVAKVLAALEQLLLHTDDWEPYANRENSLKAYQLEVSSLIIGWRRLELSSWVRLLDDQARQYIDKDDEFTLRLYGALIHGTVSSDDADSYIATALPVVTDYLSQATLGSFAHRLSVLGAFKRMASELSESKATNAAALGRVAAVLHNVIAHAQLFAPRIRESLENQRKVIDGAVKDFVKLASWKDINVFALKASAQKSHRQLHKNIRKFRGVLQQPVAPILMDLGSVCPQDPATTSAAHTSELVQVSPLSEAAVAARAAGPAVPSLLQKMPEILARYERVHIAMRPLAATTPADQLDDMAVEIIETAAMLQKATPAALTKENTKVVNNLASRKRKAFSDLLKTLRACGFSQSVPADKLAKQQSTLWLTSRPALTTHDLPAAFDAAGVTKVADYHHRQGVLMRALRAAFNGHSPDIASGDLARGIGFAESLYALALGEQALLATQLSTLSKFNAVLRRLHTCAKAPAVAGGVGQALEQAELDACHLRDGLREAEDAVRAFRELQGSVVPDLADIHAYRQEVGLLITALENALSACRAAEWPLYGHEEAQLVHRAADLFRRVVASCKAHSEAAPELAHIFLPLGKMVAHMGLATTLKTRQDIPKAVWTESDDLISALLVAAQSIDNTPAEEVKEDDYAHMPTAFTRQAKAVNSLRATEVLDRLAAFAASMSFWLAGGESSAAPAALARVLPFVEVLAQTYAQSVAAHLAATKAIYKLNYVVARVMLDIAQKGFCKPQEESDDAQDGEDGEVEGTGMGAGSGEKNVSNEITDESQVEGLQGEEEQEEEQNGDRGDDDEDNVDMENDFKGALEDGKEKDDGEEDEGEDEELDDHVGDVDPLDPGAIDEKFWNDDKEEEKKENDGREDLMDEKTEQTGESELAAKDEQSKKQDEKKEQKEAAEGEKAEEKEQESKQDGGDGEEEGEEFEEHEAPEGEDDNDNDNEGADMPEQDNVAAPEGETLDLPEDLDLGEEDDDGGNDEQFDDDIKMDEGEPEGLDMEDHGRTSDQEDEGEAEENAPDATGITEDDAQPEAEEALNQDLDVSAGEAQQEAASAGQGGTAQADKDEKADAEDKEMGGEEEDEIEAEAEGATNAAPQGAGGTDEQEASGATDSSGAPLPNEGEPQQDRSLGDIMKEIARRRDEILNKTEREEVTDNADAQEQAPGQVEYLNDGDADDDNTMQALGAAREEQQKLEDLKIVDEEEEGGPAAMDEDEPEGEEEAESGDKASREHESFRREKGEPDESLGAEKALTQAEIGGNAPIAGDAMDIDEGEGEELATEVRPDEGEIDVELTVASPSAAAEADGAEDLWRQYASLTSDLSYALCEQLRLILEPTLATRLQGDFRTGKRLNMRKIIPYIASEYTKDKIWLRRTKPSRREYQVLLSLDDSRSMAESHSVHLAYQTLALVSQALTKLEVGQVSIARFGEGVDVLHEFSDAGFSDADGAKVMRAFKFNQHRTDVAALLERTLSYLAESRAKNAGASAPDLWQLQIIISDGVCQDHNRLRTLLRRALEERVMVVFLVVDNLDAGQGSSPLSTTANTPAGSGANTPIMAPPRRSILSMQSITPTLINGKPDFVMTRYLDSFPFEFYVVLRDVEALPGVLADTLRQWMARVSQSQE